VGACPEEIFPFLVISLTSSSVCQFRRIDNTNGKRAATRRTEAEAPTKKPLSLMTAEQQLFAQKFKPPSSKLDKKRKLALRWSA
jgi:hypothetical protein